METGNWDSVGRQVLAAAIFSILGIAIFAGAFWLMAKVAPFSVKKEIAEDQNTALAIVMGSVVLGIAIIVGAAVT